MEQTYYIIIAVMAVFLIVVIYKLFILVNDIDFIKTSIIAEHDCVKNKSTEKYSSYSNIKDSNVHVIDSKPSSQYTPGTPKVDMKNPLRRGSDLIRGDVPITYIDSPIVGNSRLHENNLTSALFY